MIVLGLCVFIILLQVVGCQDVITTIAGTGTSSFSGDNGPATAAALYNLVGVHIDAEGNVYIADSFNHRIRKVTVSTGIINTLAGNGTSSYSGDNFQATSAALNYPSDIDTDPAGNAYIVDCMNHRVRKVSTSTGIITTFAGNGTSSYSGDYGPATAAALHAPYGVALDTVGNVYIADTFNHRIRKVTVSTGIITTIAGSSTSGSYSGDDGPATAATLYKPHGVAVDSLGNVYFTDTYNHRVRMVTISTGIITTIAGSGSTTYSGDNGPAASATLYYPWGIAVDSAGNVYTADKVNNRIRKVTVSTGIINSIAGNGTANYSGDNGQATSATLNNPYGVALDLAGNVYIADYGNQRVRKVTVTTNTTSMMSPTLVPSTLSTANVSKESVISIAKYVDDTMNREMVRELASSTSDIISTIAGNGNAAYSGDNGAATSAAIYSPLAVTLDVSGNVYIADYDNHRIRKVTISTGIITTYAGTGTGSYSGDNGQATSATLNDPSGVTVDASGNLYIADSSNYRIRKVTISTGIITTLAGTGTTSYSGDNGAATSAGMRYPVDVAIDASDNVYIVDDNRIRKVTVSTEIITCVAGSSGPKGFSGDDGAATSAKMSGPYGVAVDSAGNVYIGDTGNHRIRKVTVSTGIISTIAGTGASSYSGDGGQATSATLNYPNGVRTDSTGNVYIADNFNERVRKVTVSTGIITTIAGTGTGSYSGDNGPATSATLYSPTSVAFDASGNVYIADAFNNRIRKVIVSTSSPSLTPTSTPSTSPTVTPTKIPSPYPTVTPTTAAPIIPTAIPTVTPTYYPSTSPTVTPSNVPSITPTVTPTYYPSTSPTGTPTSTPSSPTVTPTYYPTFPPSVDVITTFAGNGTGAYSGDSGAATSAAIYYPNGVALDVLDNIYFADTYNHRIRKVTVSAGIITTIAGTGTGSYSGDNGPATPTSTQTVTPTELPTADPTSLPTYFPSKIPSIAPTTSPTTSPLGIPSIIPSSVPSVIPSTMQPSYTPTVSPSAYPTYSSSVLVYFTVTQGLSGISASTYSNSKVSNDALFKQTVASTLGFDMKKDDVTIQLVTDAVQERSLSAATSVQECVVMYSITSTTFIFNDANHATAMFIQALNESIATGVFDLVLHANSGSSWQSVTTAYTIFSTSSPTSSPTSTPTSAPTQRDNVVANLLTVPLDEKVAKAKVKYYLGAFMGYFLSIYICLYLYSFLRYGKLTATRLYDSSYKSELYVRCSSNEQSNKEVILLDLVKYNTVVQNTMKLEEELKVVKEVNNRSTTSNVTGKDSMYSVSVSGKLANIVTTEDEDKYSRGYHEYVQQQRTLLGCSPFLYPEGYALNIPCTNRQIVFPPGRMEDILLFLCHNHPLYSCFYFMDGSKLGAHGTRILYIGTDAAMFVLYQFSNMLIQYFMLDGLGLGVVINLFIITPSAVSVGLLLKYLYTCPFTETVEFQRKYAKYQSVVLFLGRLAILPIMVIMFGSLIIACLFSSNRDTIWILVNYFVYVQFYGIILAIAQALLLFIDGYYYKLSMFGIDILCIGQLYKERILAEQLVVDVDYAYRIHIYLFGLIKVQKILSRDDAIRAKWITIRGEGVGSAVEDIEMKGANSSNKDNETVISVQMNLLTKRTVPRNSVAFSMDGIYSSNSDDVGGYNIYSNPSSDNINNTVIATENPIHSLASMLKTVSLRPTSSRYQEAPRQQSVTLANESVNNAAEDDAALYLEYQALHDNQDEALYAMDGDSQVTVTFEEWKSRRKQFKQGTRGSFVKAFQVFEEREQLALEQLEQAAPSESVKNTLKLHSNKVKNLLAYNRALGPAANKPK